MIYLLVLYHIVFQRFGCRGWPSSGNLFHLLGWPCMHLRVNNGPYILTKEANIGTIFPLLESMRVTWAISK